MKPLHSILIAFIIIFSGCNRYNTDNLNEKASVSALDALPENPLLFSPITFSINPKKMTMSTLYGNTIAFQYAKTAADSSYPKGSVIYEVTWKQKSDSLWYGANIPDKIISIEKVEFTGNSMPKYELYKGHPLRKASFDNQNERIASIISKRLAETP